MRKIALTSAIAMALFITSCQKEAAVMPVNSSANLNTVGAQNGTSSSLLNASVKQRAAVNFQANEVFEEPGAFWNDCTQETMNYHGNVHVLVHGVINDKKLTTSDHVNYMNLSAVGETSHMAYRGSVVQNNSTNTSNLDGSYTYHGQLTLKFVAPGSKNNFIQKFYYRIVVDSNGETKTQIDEANYGTCQ